MTSDRLTRAKPELLILAPGPINRGVEMTAEVADCRQSLILDQVTNGLAVRMGVLWLTCGPREPGVAANGPTNAQTRNN
jgi:aspartate carbamoyltransferase catalytic subunit